MWLVVLMLVVPVAVDSYFVHDVHERLDYGRQLKIFLPKSAHTLAFTPASNPDRTFVYWQKEVFRTSKGRVSGTGSDRRWYIDKVTYEDQGTYVQRDFWNKDISTVKVAVRPRHRHVTCVPGESLYISLEGINLTSAVLSFSGESANVTLVHKGARVSEEAVDFWERIHTNSMNIEIRNVNVSDEGHYTLRDGRDRVVSVTRMDLTDHKDAGNPLAALLLLLAVPAGICCCCRKKIFKKKSSGVLQTTPDAVHNPPSGPAGPCPPYGQPGYNTGTYPGMGPTVHPPPSQVGPGQWNGPPAPQLGPGQWSGPPPPHVGPEQWSGPPPPHGFSAATSPHNPAFPPTAAFTSNQAPQWNAPPPPAAAAMNTAPVASEPMKEGEKMEMDNMSSPSNPLLSAQPQAAADSPLMAPEPPSSPDAAPSSDGGYQFKIDGGKTNFL